MSSRAPTKNAVQRKQTTVCKRLEQMGNDLNVRLGPNGSLFLAAPLGNGAGLSVRSLLPSLGCNGTFAKALISIETTTLGIFANPSKLERFRALMPHTTVKLNYLRTVIQSL